MRRTSKRKRDPDFVYDFEEEEEDEEEEVVKKKIIKDQNESTSVNSWSQYVDGHSWPQVKRTIKEMRQKSDRYFQEQMTLAEHSLSLQKAVNRSDRKRLWRLQRRQQRELSELNRRSHEEYNEFWKNERKHARERRILARSKVKGEKTLAEHFLLMKDEILDKEKEKELQRKRRQFMRTQQIRDQKRWNREEAAGVLLCWRLLSSSEKILLPVHNEKFLGVITNITKQSQVTEKQDGETRYRVSKNDHIKDMELTVYPIMEKPKSCDSGILQPVHDLDWMEWVNTNGDLKRDPDLFSLKFRWNTKMARFLRNPSNLFDTYGTQLRAWFPDQMVDLNRLYLYLKKHSFFCSFTKFTEPLWDLIIAYATPTPFSPELPLVCQTKTEKRNPNPNPNPSSDPVVFIDWSATNELFAE